MLVWCPLVVNDINTLSSSLITYAFCIKLSPNEVTGEKVTALSRYHGGYFIIVIMLKKIKPCSQFHTAA